MHNALERGSPVSGDAEVELARREIAQALKLAVLFGEDRLARKHLGAGVRTLLRIHCGLAPERSA